MATSKAKEAPEPIPGTTVNLTSYRMTAEEFVPVSEALKQPVDPKLIRQREGWRDRNGNVQTVDYIEWHTATDILDEVAPDWEHQIREIKFEGDFVLITVALWVGGICREGVGTGTSRSEMGIKKAEHDALKRAAVKFGIGRELYHKFDPDGERLAETQPVYGSGHNQAPPPQQQNYSGQQGGNFQPPRNPDGSTKFPADPVAKTLADMITTKQLGMIRAVAREAGVDADEECTAVMNCQVTELSRRGASALIDHLRGLQEHNSPIRRVN